MTKPDCPRCECEMQPIWFIEEEINEQGYKTGRKCRSCSHFECPICGKKECVDMFDSAWYKD